MELYENERNAGESSNMKIELPVENPKLLLWNCECNDEGSGGRQTRSNRADWVERKAYDSLLCFACLCSTRKKTIRISLMVIASALKRDVFDPYKQTDVSVEVLHLALVDL